MQITTDKLRRMTNQEGLILKGCGGDVFRYKTGKSPLFKTKGTGLKF